MPYKLRIQHMDRDFQIHDHGVDPWDLVIAEDAELIIFLNRLAIASSQTTAIEHAEVEISVGSKRATVTAIKGQLFFSDLNKIHVQNLRVIAEEIVGFLTDRILPGTHEQASESEDWDQALPRYRDQGRRTADAIRAAAFAILLAVLVLCSFQVWKTLNHNPGLVRHSEFVPGLQNADSFLDRLGGMYIDAAENAGLVIEIGPKERFRIYEIWSRPGGKGYALNLLEEYTATVGMNNGKEAILVAGYYLVLPETETRVRMFGKSFDRYDRKRDPLNLWAKGEN